MEREHGGIGVVAPAPSPTVRTAPSPVVSLPQGTTRWLVLIAIGSVMLLIDRVATATSSLGGFGGRILSHTDAGRGLILVGGSVLILRPWSAAGRETGRMPSLRSWYLRCAVACYGLWAIAAASAIAALHPELGARQLLSTLVIFRPVGSTPIVDGLGVGPLVLELAIVAALAPLLPRVRSRWMRAARPATVALVSLAALGIVIRIVLIAADRRSPTGLLSTIVADLDLLAIALAIVVAPSLRTRRPAGGARPALLAAAVAVAAFGGLLTVRQARVPGGESAAALVAQTVLAALFAAGVALFVVTAPAPAERWRRAATWIAIAAPGLLLFHETAFVLIARQYVERYRTDVLGVHLDGVAFPPFLWALVVSAAIGIALSLLVVRPVATYGMRMPVGARGWFAGTAAGVVALAFVWRVIALVTIAPDRVDGGDPLFYHTTANTLAAGRGFPEPLHWIAYGQQLKTALHGPLFSIVLSFVSRFGGTAYVDHRMAATLLGALVVLAVVLVGRRLGGDLVGIVAGVIAAFYPNLWLIDGVLFPEGLMAALVMFTILLTYSWHDRPGWRRAAGIGALIGLTALTRGEGIFLMGLLVLPIMLRDKRLAWKQRWTQFGAACLACLVVLAPWMIRNLVSYEEFVPLSTNGNELLVYANCDEAYNGKFIGFWYFDCEERIRQEKGEPPGDESQRAIYWRQVGIDYAKDHLGQLPEVVAARVGRQWDVFRPWQNAEFAPIEGRNKNGARVGLFAYYLLVAFGAFGLRSLWRRRVPLLPLTAQFASVTITAAAAYGTVRFRAPVEPVLCLLAAIGAVPLLRRIRARFQVPAASDVPIDDPGAFVLGGPMFRRRFSWATLTGSAIVAFFTLLPVRGMYHSTGGTMEEGFMLSFPERMLKGAVANVDFLHLYGPGSLDVLAGWYSIFGLTLTTERTFGLIQHAAIIIGLYVLARAWGRAAACATAVLSVFLILTPIGLTAMAWNGGVALGLWSVIVAVRARNVEQRDGIDPERRARRVRTLYAVAGLLAGLTITYRPDLGFALLITHAWLMWRRRTAWVPFALGSVVGLLMLIVHVLRIGIGRAIETMITDPIVKLRPGRELPRPPSWSHLDGALQAIAETVPPWWRFPAIAAERQLFLWFFALPVFALIVVGTGLYLVRRTAGSPRSIALAAGGLFGLGLMPQALQRPDSTHLTWVACISWPLLVPAGIELLRMRAPRLHPRWRVTFSAAFLAAAMFVLCPFFTYRTYLLYTRVSVGDLPPAYEVSRGDRVFYMGDRPPALATQGVIDTLDQLSSPGERLLVGPVDLRRTWYSDTFFYYLFPELPPSTYFMEMDPGIANAEGSPLADEVASSDWVLLTSFWAGWREPNTAMDFGSDAPNEVVRTQFCLVRSFENGLVELYHRCDEPLPVPVSPPGVTTDPTGIGRPEPATG